MATEVDESTDSGKLFQREGAQELNNLFQALVLPWLNRLFFTKSFVGQQTDLEINSRFYWQPMKGA